MCFGLSSFLKGGGKRVCAQHESDSCVLFIGGERGGKSKGMGKWRGSPLSQEVGRVISQRVASNPKSVAMALYSASRSSQLICEGSTSTSKAR